MVYNINTLRKIIKRRNKMFGLVIYVLWFVLGICGYVLEQRENYLISMVCYTVFFCFVPFFPFVWHMLGMF